MSYFTAAIFISSIVGHLGFLLGNSPLLQDKGQDLSPLCWLLSAEVSGKGQVLASPLSFILCWEEEPPYCLVHLREGVDEIYLAFFSHFSAEEYTSPYPLVILQDLGSQGETHGYLVLSLDKLLVSGNVVLRCSLLLSKETIFSKPSLLVLIVVFSLHMLLFLSKLFRIWTKKRRKIISGPLIPDILPNSQSSCSTQGWPYFLKSGAAFCHVLQVWPVGIAHPFGHSN